MPINATIQAVREIFEGGLSRDALMIEGYNNAHGEKSNVFIDTNAQYGSLVQSSLQALETFDAGMINEATGIDEAICQTALDELRTSLQNTLDKHAIGEANDAYTHKGSNKRNGEDTYEGVAVGVKIHKENGDIHIQGVVVNKTIVEAGQYPTRRKRAKTIAKNWIRERLPTSKWRQYKLSHNFVTIRNGQRIFNPADFQ